MSIPAAPSPRGGGPRAALAVGAVRDAPDGVDIQIQDQGRRLHKLASRPTTADGFDEASVAPDGYEYGRLPSLPRHPSLMRDQMGSGQSHAFGLPVVNGLVAGGACGGSTCRDAYHHGT